MTIKKWWKMKRWEILSIIKLEIILCLSWSAIFTWKISPWGKNQRYPKEPTGKQSWDTEMQNLSESLHKEKHCHEKLSLNSQTVTSKRLPKHYRLLVLLLVVESKHILLKSSCTSDKGFRGLCTGSDRGASCPKEQVVAFKLSKGENKWQS